MQGGHHRTLPGTRKGGEEFQVELPEGGEELRRQGLHAAALRNVHEVAVDHPHERTQVRNFFIKCL